MELWTRGKDQLSWKEWPDAVQGLASLPVSAPVEVLLLALQPDRELPELLAAVRLIRESGSTRCGMPGSTRCGGSSARGPGSLRRIGLWGKLLITLAMFVGRLGPLTMAVAIGRKGGGEEFQYAEEGVMVG